MKTYADIRREFMEGVQYARGMLPGQTRSEPISTQSASAPAKPDPTGFWDQDADEILDAMGAHQRNMMLEELDDASQTGRSYKPSSRKGKAARRTTFRDHPYYIRWLRKEQKKHPHITWFVRWRRDKRTLKYEGR